MKTLKMFLRQVIVFQKFLFSPLFKKGVSQKMDITAYGFQRDHPSALELTYEYTSF